MKESEINFLVCCTVGGLILAYSWWTDKKEVGVSLQQILKLQENMSVEIPDTVDATMHNQEDVEADVPARQSARSRYDPWTSKRMCWHSANHGWYDTHTRHRFNHSV